MNNENLKPFKSGDDSRRNLCGRPKGVKNRSTIVQAIMDANITMPEKVFKKLKEIYPDMANNLTIEEAMAYIQVTKAIQGKDTAAYKVLMDSAYGMPKQSTDITSKGQKIKGAGVCKITYSGINNKE